MKNIRYTYYLWSALMLLLLTSLTTCSRDDSALSDGDGLIVMSLSGVQTRGGDLFTGDELLKKVRIFVFVNNQLEKNIVFTSGENEFSNPFKLTVATGTKDVYVVANEDGALSSTLATVNTRTGLKSLLANPIGSPVTPPITMAGEVLGVQVVQSPTGEQNKANVSLRRVAAKITLLFKKDSDAEVKITKVSLFNNTGLTPLWEGGATINNQNYWDFSHTFSTPLEISTVAAPIDGYQHIYVYENLAGPTNKDKATRLEVEAIYNNIPTTYRVYINEYVNTIINPGDPNSSVTPQDHLYQIKRNHQYVLTGTIIARGEIDGLVLQVKVMPWDLIETDIEFNDEAVQIVTIPEFETVEGNTTSTSNPLTFKFTLQEGPEDATWEASLDNGLEFAFEDIANTKGVLGVEKTITIKPLKPYDATIQRTTHFYITVTNPANGTKQKIPLVSGQAATQILIKQVM